MPRFSERYQQIRYLGRGVTGEVVLAKDSKTGQNCAVKFLRKSRTSGKAATRHAFKEEFDVLKNLNHPYIARVYDTGFDDETDRLYIVTEYVDGKDLFYAAVDKPVEFVEELLIQSLRALNYLHQHGICHLDIKPQNILVTTDDGGGPLVKIIDFGFAHSRATATRAQSNEGLAAIIGTAPFTAPEIIKGESFDGRADLYSLACSFFKVLAGTQPFRGHYPEEIHQKHLLQSPLAPSSLNHAVPEYLDKIILKLLSKDPKDRYSKASDVIEEINILTFKNYPVETKQTIMSYLPEQGEMIGREDEFEKFKLYFEDRIRNKTYSKEPYLIISGNEGTGKTRFLQECKHEAQKFFVSVLTLEEFDKYPEGQAPSPCLILADNNTIDRDELIYATFCYKREPVLTVFATRQKPDDYPHECKEVIALDNFDLDLTRTYIQKATGINAIPDWIVNTVFEQTQGNPLFLAEYIKTLFDAGFFRDAQGRWSEKILDDLGVEIKKYGVSGFIQNRFLAVIESLHLSDVQRDTLNYMALSENMLSIDDLIKITGNLRLNEDLVYFTEHKIFKPLSGNRITFLNSNFAKIIMSRIACDEKSAYCERLAEYFEKKGASKDQILFFRGRGTGPQAFLFLLELAKKNYEELEFDQAKENLADILCRDGIKASVRDEALLMLGELFLDDADYDSAVEWFAKLEAQTTDIVFKTRALYLLGLCFNRKGTAHKSTECFEQAKKLCHGLRSHKALWVSIKNWEAMRELESGNINRAQDIAQSTWKIWHNELDDDEKIEAIKRNDSDMIFHYGGKHKEAIAYLEEQLAVVSKTPHLDYYPRTIMKLGVAYLRSGEPVKGKRLLLQTLDLIKQNRTPKWLYAVYNELGNIEDAEDHYDEAVKYYKHALDLAKKSHAGVNLFIIAGNMATLCFKKGDFDGAQKHAGFVLDCIKKNDFINVNQKVYCLFSAHLTMAMACLHKGEHIEGDWHLGQAAEILSAHDSLKQYRLRLLTQKAESYKIKKQMDKAHEVEKEIERLKLDPDFDESNYRAPLKNLP
ncbi:MAG: protein kinase [Deltaproteobacteria bacterium]|nr:protein kinase [Deltaproteobacteria bacterium]